MKRPPKTQQKPNAPSLSPTNQSENSCEPGWLRAYSLGFGILGGACLLGLLSLLLLFEDNSPNNNYPEGLGLILIPLTLFGAVLGAVIGTPIARYFLSAWYQKELKTNTENKTLTSPETTRSMSSRTERRANSKAKDSFVELRVPKEKIAPYQNPDKRRDSPSHNRRHKQG